MTDDPYRPVKLPAFPADGILPGSVEDVLALSQALQLPDGQTASERVAEILDAYDIPQQLRNAWARIDEEARGDGASS
jgi:hypothetical protein